MLSKGGKIEYSCPYCYNVRITRVHVKPVWAALLRDGQDWTEKEWDEGIRMSEDHGECPNCNSWFHWTMRIKTSLKEKKHEINN